MEGPTRESPIQNAFYSSSNFGVGQNFQSHFLSSLGNNISSCATTVGSKQTVSPQPGEHATECPVSELRRNQTGVNNSEKSHKLEVIPDNGNLLMSEEMSCKHCDQKFSFKNAFYEHLRIYHNYDKPYTCLERGCDKAFLKRKSLDCHLRDFHRLKINIVKRQFVKVDGKWKCDLCDKSYNSIATVSGHRFRHFEPRFNCIYCELKCFDIGSLRIHLKRHMGERVISHRKYPCPNCKIEFQFKRCLIQHKCGEPIKPSKGKRPKLKLKNKGCQKPVQKTIKETKEGSIICEICGNSYSNKNGLIHHRNKMHSVNRCGLCSTNFSKPQELLYHYEEIHNEEPPVELLKRIASYGHKIGEYLCEVCSKVYYSISSLRHHIKRHYKDKIDSQCPVCMTQYLSKKEMNSHLEEVHKDHDMTKIVPLTLPKCDVCDREYVNEESLLRHKNRAHGQETICQYCGKIYPRGNRREYENHINLHLGKRNFKCDQCDQKFQTKQNMITHQQRRHLIHNPLYCRQCKKLFVTKEKHQEHLNEIHVLKFKLLCEICHWGFNDKNKLIIHVRNAHRDEMHKDFKHLKCLYCPKRYASWNALRKHYTNCKANVEKIIPRGKNGHSKFEEVVPVVEEFLCKMCFFVFANRNDCYNHFKSVHKLLSEDSFDSYVIVAINSKNSNTLFNKLDDFFPNSNHSELKERPFLCKVCRKSFLSMRGYNRHVKFLHRTLERVVDECDGGKIQPRKMFKAKKSFYDEDSSEFSDSEDYDDETDLQVSDTESYIDEEDESGSDIDAGIDSKETTKESEISIETDGRNKFHSDDNSVTSLHSNISNGSFSSSEEKANKNTGKITTRQSARLKAKSITKKRAKSSKCTIRRYRGKIKAHVGERKSVTKEESEPVISNTTEKVAENDENNVEDGDTSLIAGEKIKLTDMPIAEAFDQGHSKLSQYKLNVDTESRLNFEEEDTIIAVNDEKNFTCKACNTVWEKLIYFEKHVNEFHPDYYDIYPREKPDYSYLKLVARETMRIMKEKIKQKTPSAREPLTQKPKRKTIRKSKLKLIRVLPNANSLTNNDSYKTPLNNKENLNSKDDSGVDDVPLTSRDKHLNSDIEQQEASTSRVTTIPNSINLVSNIPSVPTQSNNPLPEVSLGNTIPANTGDFLNNFLYSSGNERSTSFNNNNLSAPNAVNYAYNNQPYQNYQLPRNHYAAMNQNPMFLKPSFRGRPDHQLNQNTAKEFSLPEWDNVFTSPVKNKNIHPNTNQLDYPNSQNHLQPRETPSTTTSFFSGNSIVPVQNSCLNQELNSTNHNQPNYPGSLIPLANVANYQAPLATSNAFATTLPHHSEDHQDTLQVSNLVTEPDEDQTNIHDTGFDINYGSESDCDEPRINNDRSTGKSLKPMDSGEMGSNTDDGNCRKTNGQYESHFINFTKSKKIETNKEDDCEAINDSAPKLSDVRYKPNVKYNPPHLSSKELEEALSKTYTCQKCPMYYTRRQSLITHYKRDHSDITECLDFIKALENEKIKTETCHICQKQFPGGRKLKDHIRFAHNEKQFPCAICGKTFQRMPYLKAHLAIHEKVGLLQPNDDMEISYDECKFECHSCDQIFTRKNSLVRHLESHKKIELWFKCPKCEGKFTTLNNFKKHLFSHKEFYPFVCCNCERELESLNELEIHIENECNKMYKCSKCDLTFENVRAMRYHIYDRHIDDRLECPACSRKFSEILGLNKHLYRRREKDNECDKDETSKRRKMDKNVSLDEGMEDSHGEESLKRETKKKQLSKGSRIKVKLKVKSKSVVKKRRKICSAKICSDSESGDSCDDEKFKLPKKKSKNSKPINCNVRPSRACKPKSLTEIDTI